MKGPKGTGVGGPGFQVRAWHARCEWMVSPPWGAVTVGGARGRETKNQRPSGGPTGTCPWSHDTLAFRVPDLEVSAAPPGTVPGHRHEVEASARPESYLLGTLSRVPPLGRGTAMERDPEPQVEPRPHTTKA